MRIQCDDGVSITGAAAGAITLSATQVACEPDVFDRLFALAFDTLGLHALTIRVHEDRPDDAGMVQLCP